jgi:hypothetical protein
VSTLGIPTFQVVKSWEVREDAPPFRMGVVEIRFPSGKPVYVYYTWAKHPLASDFEPAQTTTFFPISSRHVESLITRIRQTDEIQEIPTGGVAIMVFHGPWDDGCRDLCRQLGMRRSLMELDSTVRRAGPLT